VFLGLIGYSTMTLGGVSTSTANMPLYVDFYLLLDNSPSMGVGATPTDVKTMVNNTPDQCAFACHDVSNSRPIPTNSAWRSTISVSRPTPPRSPVFCVVIQPDERPDRCRHDRPDDGQRTK
jgi:hypothetical protein